jgi:hypothetical protein
VLSPFARRIFIIDAQGVFVRLSLRECQITDKLLRIHGYPAFYVSDEM